MPNACIFIGKVENVPDRLMNEDKERRATFILDIHCQGRYHGWIKVVLLGETAELAVNLLPETTVIVVGKLIRGRWKTGQEVWWDEIMLIASYVEVIE